MSCPKNCDCKSAVRFIFPDVRDVYSFAFVLIRPCESDALKLASFPPGLKEPFLRACGYAHRSPGNADGWKWRVCRARRRSALGRERWSGVPRRRASDRNWFGILKRRIPRGRPAMSRRLAKLVIANARRCGFAIPRSEKKKKQLGGMPFRWRAIWHADEIKSTWSALRRAHFDAGGTRSSWDRLLKESKREERRFFGSRKHQRAIGITRHRRVRSAIARLQMLQAEISYALERRQTPRT